MTPAEVHQMILAQDDEYKLSLWLACWKVGITIPEFEKGLCSFVNEATNAISDIWDDLKRILESRQQDAQDPFL